MGEGRGEGRRSAFRLRWRNRLHRTRIIRQRVRSARLQLAEDGLTYALAVASQAPVPKAQDLDAARFKKLLPFLIVLLLVGMSVAEPVEFDRQPGFLAVEVQVVAAFRMLSSGEGEHSSERWRMERVS